MVSVDDVYPKTDSYINLILLLKKPFKGKYFSLFEGAPYRFLQNLIYQIIIST